MGLSSLRILMPIILRKLFLVRSPVTVVLLWAMVLPALAAVFERIDCSFFNLIFYLCVFFAHGTMLYKTFNTCMYFLWVHLFIENLISLYYIGFHRNIFKQNWFWLILPPISCPSLYPSPPATDFPFSCHNVSLPSFPLLKAFPLSCGFLCSLEPLPTLTAPPHSYASI